VCLYFVGYVCVRWCIYTSHLYSSRHPTHSPGYCIAWLLILMSSRSFVRRWWILWALMTLWPQLISARCLTFTAVWRRQWG